MIKCNKSSVEIEGNVIDVLSELGLLSDYIVKIMQRDMSREFAVEVVKTAINAGIELSGQEDLKQKRMQEVAEILKNMEESEE